VVASYLRGLSEPDRRAIEVVSIDPYEAYRQAIRAELPWARIVDHFHLVRGANAALDSVRRERQRQARTRSPKGARQGGKAGWRQSLFHARHRLLKAHERLTAQQRRQLVRPVRTRATNRRGLGTQRGVRSVYRAPNCNEAERRLDAFLAAVDRAQIPSFNAFASGIRQRRCELLAYFDEPTTNGYAEGVINKVKVAKGRAYGLTHVRRLPQARRCHSMRLTRNTRRHPAQPTRTQFSTGAAGSISSGLDKRVVLSVVEPFRSRSLTDESQRPASPSHEAGTAMDGNHGANGRMRGYTSLSIGGQSPEPYRPPRRYETRACAGRHRTGQATSRQELAKSARSR
jgi:hypothetical protein